MKKTVRVIDPFKLDSDTKRVAAYCRVSSDSEDQLSSYASQIKHYTHLIHSAPNYELVDIYADEGISGTSLKNRDEFARMMRDCRMGKIDKILVKSVSRFARNTKDCFEAIRELKSIGVTVKFEKEHIDTEDFTSEFMLTVAGSLAQEESGSISKNQRWSYQKRMESGEFITCNAPLGYRLVNGKNLEICEEEAEIVRWIFDSYLSGMNMHDIAKSLKKRGILSSEGNLIKSHTSISYILTNEKYIGNSLTGKTYMTWTLPAVKKKNTGELDMYYTENSHPAIISKEVFEKTQEFIKSRIAYEYGGYAKYSFTKKIKCADCGSSFGRRMNKSGYVSWGCLKHDADKRLCEMPRVPESELKSAFMKMWGKLKAHGDYILTPILAELKELEASVMRNNPQMAQFSEEIATLMGQHRTLLRLNTQGILDAETYRDKSAEVSAKLRDVKAKRRQVLNFEEDDSIGNIKLLTEILENTDITQFEEELFEEVVERIVVESSERIRIRLKGGVEFTESICGKVR